ncbi:MAG: aminotransferase class I/II-fold pyridoxal phosphate-dependent enzyme [Pseudonocardiaceae bacterium]
MPARQRGWPGEPGMGGWYTAAEHAAVAAVMTEMTGWTHAYRRIHQEAFEEAFAAYTGAAHAVAVNSGGVALDLAMACLDAQPGDEVISCAINFPGSHLAVLGAGLRLVLAEPDPRTLNLDPADVAVRMTGRTVAVLITHMNGLPADVGGITAAADVRARELGIATPRIVVDAARAPGAATPAGRVGGDGAWITMFSFHRKKLMTTLGEGGMLTTGCAATARALRRLRSFGHGQVWGSSYRMTEAQAAVGVVQLGRLEEMLAPRITLAHARTGQLADVAGITLPVEPAGFRHVYSLYTVICDPCWPPGARDRIHHLLGEARVGVVIANPPTYAVNRLIAERTAGQWPLPVAEDVAARLFCTALHPLMSAAENTRIATVVRAALDQVRRERA